MHASLLKVETERNELKQLLIHAEQNRQAIIDERNDAIEERDEAIKALKEIVQPIKEYADKDKAELTKQRDELSTKCEQLKAELEQWQQMHLADTTRFRAQVEALTSQMAVVQNIINKHGCSSPKDCGLHFLNEQLAKFKTES